MDNQAPQGQQQQPSTQPQAPQVVSGGQARKSFLKPLVIVVLLGLLIGGGFLGFTLIKEGGREVTPSPQVPGTLPTSPIQRTTKADMLISDSFDSFSLDTERWHDWISNKGAEVAQKDSRIEIAILPGNIEYTEAGLNSTRSITGDFEASVDITIEEGGEAFGSEAALVFHDSTPGWANQISIYVRKELEDQVVLHAVTILSGTETEIAEKAYDYPGPFKVRITRAGGIVTFNVREGDDFVPIGQATTGFFEGDGGISLHVNSRGPDFPAVLSAFDNFVLKFL